MDGVGREELLMIYFEIPGKAEGKGRPRFMRNGHTYTPEKTRNYEELVRLMYREKCKEEPTADAVKVSILVWVVPAKSLSKKKKDEETALPPMKKPDVDNIAKIILDALNGVAWLDDKQVCHLDITKYWGYTEKVGVHIIKAEEREENE